VNGDNNPDPNAPLQYDHAAAGADWAKLINEMRDEMTANGWDMQVNIQGGSDIETGQTDTTANPPRIGFEPPTLTKLWLSGFGSARSLNVFMYDYGDAGGCPENTHTGTERCNVQYYMPTDTRWTQDDVWVAAAGTGFSVAFPEIYARPNAGDRNNIYPGVISANASQWEEIALYSYYVQNTRMFFVAPLSQYYICHASGTLSPECVNNDNTPRQAYDSLYIALHYDPETAQTPPFASDLRATN